MCISIFTQADLKEKETRPLYSSISHLVLKQESRKSSPNCLESAPRISYEWYKGQIPHKKTWNICNGYEKNLSMTLREYSKLL